MNLFTNLSLHTAVVNVRFFSRGQIVSRLLAGVVGRCQRVYLLAICHHFAVCSRLRQGHKGAALCSSCSENDVYLLWLGTESCNIKIGKLKIAAAR